MASKMRNTTNGAVMGCLFILMLIYCTDAERPGKLLRDDALEICGHIGLGIYEAPLGAFCCLCPKGFYLKKHCRSVGSQNEPEKRECVPCPFDAKNPSNQTFMSDQNNASFCTPSLGKFYCEQNFQHAYRKTATQKENARCVCKDGYRTATGTEDISHGCHKHGECIKGFQPRTYGNATHDPFCEPCPSGTFSNVSSSTDKCIAWKKCTASETAVKNGTRTNDTICDVKATPSSITKNDLSAYIPETTTSYASNPTEADFNGTNTGTRDAVLMWSGIGVFILFVFSCVYLFYRCRKKPQDVTMCNEMKLLNICGRSKEGMNGTDDGGQTVTSRLLNGGTSSPTTQDSSLQLSQLGSSVQNGRTCSPTEQDSSSEHSQLGSSVQDEIVERGQPKDTARPFLPPNANPAPPPPVNLGNYTELKDFERRKIQESGLANYLPRSWTRTAVAKDMLLYLANEQATDDLLPTLRLFGLTHQDETDAKKEKQSESEVRVHMVRTVVRRQGSNLTPKILFEKQYPEQETRDLLFKEFCAKM